METITIKDIAKALNLSTSTVSRALRDSYEINPETKKLVIEYAKKVNYKPNPIALSLQGSNSKAIGVIVPVIANNFFAETINGIEEIAYSRGYHVVIFQTNESFEREVISVESAIARRVDGLLISLSGETTTVSHLKELQAKGLPLVMFDRVSDEIDTFKVISDNFEGAFKATEHLIQTGRSVIAEITSLPWLSITQERLAGYRAALEKHGIRYDGSYIKFCGFEEIEAGQAIDELMGKNPKPQAIIMGSDRLALSCLRALKERNIRIPEDIALIGFTNLNVADRLDPPLSTVVQSAFEIGQAAVNLLIDLIEKKNKAFDYQTFKLNTTLFVRNSSVSNF